MQVRVRFVRNYNLGSGHPAWPQESLAKAGDVLVLSDRLAKRAIHYNAAEQIFEPLPPTPPPAPEAAVAETRETATRPSAKGRSKTEA